MTTETDFHRPAVLDILTDRISEIDAVLPDKVDRHFTVLALALLVRSSNPSPLTHSNRTCTLTNCPWHLPCVMAYRTDFLTIGSTYLGLPFLFVRSVVQF